jgi:hypothetical protein
MTKSTVRPTLLGAVLAAATAVAVATAQGPTPGPAPVFTAVQPDLLGVRNSLANAWGDYDNDGDLDLAVSLGTGEIRLYRNDQGVLTSVGRELGMPQSGQEFRGLSWGDLDGDGFLDLLGGATEKSAVSVVLRSDRGQRFTDIAAAIGLTMPNRSARQTNLVDYDNDGDLDVYATDRAGDNRLYRNDSGRFTHVFAGVGPTDARATVGACWFDMDEDGDLDLFLANQAGAADALWRNDGDRFVDVAVKLGVAGPKRTPAEGGVGCAIGDYDNDGDFDIFVPNYGHNQLYRRNADGTFTDVAASLGLSAENHAVGADWGDIDNDGDLDLSVMSYEGPANAQTPTNALFRNEGEKGFVNVIGTDSPLNKGDHGVQLVDYDHDGALDLTLTDGYGEVGGHFVFRNQLPDEAKRRSLSVLVLDARGHHTRFGAEVRVKDAGGRLLAARPVVTGGGYNTQRAAPVHVGLPSLAPVTVEVTFMSRSGRRTQTVRDVSPAAYYGKSLIVREAP